jgi:hypothetical protein
MSFKYHLLIVSIIIIALFGIMKTISNKAPEPQQVVVVQTSPYEITIERADWGVNCKTSTLDKRADNYMQPNNQRKMVENNVLSRVGEICNGKHFCEIPINVEALGEDPLPECGFKVLQVEFRCFAIDRLRTSKASEGSIVIDCDKLFANP